MGISEITSVAWGVSGKSAQFECKSGASLKKNKNGDFILNDKGRKIDTEATVAWEYYDSGTSSWKLSTEDDRFVIQPSLIGTNGIRVSPIILSNLEKTEDGLKVRCNIEYTSDTDNMFYGATVTSGEMELKIAHITSVTASNNGPINGDEIILTCVAVGEKEPNFVFELERC
jgi:hypothetical protein